LAGFSRRQPASILKADESVPSAESGESSADAGDTRKFTIVDGALPKGSVSCQLLALAIPPSMQGANAMYATLSDAISRRIIDSTMAGAKAAAKMAAALGEPELKKTPGTFTPEITETVKAIKEQPMIKTGKEQLMTSAPVKSAYRFHFADPTALLHVPIVQKSGLRSKLSDDGSNWIVEDGLGGGSHRPYRASRLSGSGSAWGGGGAMLEPLGQGKFNCDQPIKVVLPAGPLA